MSFLNESVSMFLASNQPNNLQPAANFSTTLEQPLVLSDGRWCVALCGLNVWNTNPNITAALGNNKINVCDNYTGGTGTWNSCVFPDGLYAISDIITYFDNFIDTTYSAVNTNTILAINSPLLTCEWTINAQWGIDMSVSKIGSVLGFGVGQQTIGPVSGTQIYIGNLQADISNGISNYLVHCNCLDAGRSYVNGNPSDVIFSYTPSAPQGSLINYVPTFPIFMDATQATLSNIVVYITDQRNNPVTLNVPGEYYNNPTSLQLVFVRKGDDIAKTQSVNAYNEKLQQGYGRRR